MLKDAASILRLKRTVLVEVLFEVLLVVILCAVPAAPISSAQTGTVFRPDPLNLEIGVGQVEALNIVIENVKDLYGVEAHLKFDPSVVEVVDADSGKDGIQVIPGGFPQPDFVAVNKADNKAGTIDFAATQLNPTPPVSGGGIAFTIQFRGKTLGKKTKITAKGNILPVVVGPQKVQPTTFTWQDGTITIVPPKPPTPTPFLTATATRPPTVTPVAPATDVPPEVINQPSRSAASDTLMNAVLLLIACGGCLGALIVLAVAVFVLLKSPRRRPNQSQYDSPNSGDVADDENFETQ